MVGKGLFKLYRYCSNFPERFEATGQHWMVSTFKKWIYLKNGAEFSVFIFCLMKSPVFSSVYWNTRTLKYRSGQKGEEKTMKKKLSVWVCACMCVRGFSAVFGALITHNPPSPLTLPFNCIRTSCSTPASCCFSSPSSSNVSPTWPKCPLTL